MADNDFYKTEEVVETPEPQAPEQVAEKIKVGEAEYTQDELNVLIEKGKFAKDIEDKQNIKLDKVWPGHQELSNKVRALEEENAGLKQAKTATKVETGVELSEAEQIAQAKVEAKKLGLLTVDEVDSYIDRRLEAVAIREDVQNVVSEARDKYGIATSEDDLLTYMVETGIRNPQLALKAKFEEQIDAWKTQQIDKAKKPGMVTDSTSSAGSKQPKAEPVTKDNFGAKIDEVLDRQA